MTTAATDLRQANLIGALWMVLAMVLFAIEDALLKQAAATVSVGQAMLCFGLGGAVVFALHLLATGQRLFHPDVLSLPMRIRVVFEVLGRLFYVLAVALAPLSSATVILQATPLVVVAAAALIFGEKVGWRRWMAILIGLTGVLVILRPTGDSFTMLSVLAVLGMLGFAGRDLASRAAPGTLSTSTLGLYGFLSLATAGGLFLIWEGKPLVTPTQTDLGLMAIVIFVGIFAYSSLMKAMRTGEVSAVTPFRYSRLLFGVGIGVVWFDESFDGYMAIGSGLIVLSGLFILWRGKQRPNPQRS